jgi:hypothetical protein
VNPILYLLLPAEQRVASPGGPLLTSVAQGATLLMTFFWLEAIVGVLGLAVVPALSSLVRKANEGWTRFATNLALAGSVITAVGYFLTVARLPGIAAAYAKGDASTQAALLPLWKSSIDLQGFWGYGAIGVWVLIVSLLALRGAANFPKAFNYIGLVVAVLYLLIPLGVIFKQQELLLLVDGLGLLAGPIWFIWAGLQLRRTA